ncbi:MAG TPA: TonB-dependent receptor [Hymenobacter sp.]|nr:TonB-dependent receptor [Hymenobacter sp.]
MKKETTAWTLVQATCLCLLAGQAAAQQDTLKTYNLNEVVVTATKFPKKESETGKVLTVIDGEQLARSAGKTIAQLLNEQAGLVVNGANGNPGQNKSVYLRGANNEYTLILLDGIPVNDPSGIGGGAYDLRLLPLDQVERIEILKGAQSTLYGSDAIAGVINIITKKGGTRPVGGYASLSAGSYDTYRAQVGVNGRVKAFDYNIGFTHFDTGGVSEAKDTTRADNFDRDGAKQNAFNATIGFQATEKLNLKPFLRATGFRGKYDGGSFTDDTVARYNSKLFSTGLLGQYTLSKGAVNLQYAFDKTNRDFTTSYGESKFRGRFHSAEVFVNYDVAEYVQLLTGLNFQHQQMLDTTSTITDPKVDIVSPYVSLFLRGLGGLNLELGSRYNHHSKYGNNVTYSINPSYLVDEKVKLFANYSTGFKAPTLYQLYGEFGANPNLKPERSHSLEGGVQAFLSDSKLDVRVVAFQRRIKDAIQYTFRPGYINLNRQNDRGLEVEPTFRPNDKLTIRGFYAYVTGKVTTKAGERDTTYANLIRRPNHSFGLNVGYHLTPALFVSTNLKTFGQRGDLFFNSETFATEAATLKAYQLWDVYAEYQLFGNKLKLFVDAKNLLGQEYFETYGYTTLGRNANAGVSFTY